MRVVIALTISYTAACTLTGNADSVSGGCVLLHKLKHEDLSNFAKFILFQPVLTITEDQNSLAHEEEIYATWIKG